MVCPGVAFATLATLVNVTSALVMTVSVLVIVFVGVGSGVVLVALAAFVSVNPLVTLGATCATTTNVSV
jgi:hypothetical protein